jgi:hypothetical protein
MERNGVVAADSGEGVVGRAAGAHVVFGVDFEEPADGLVSQDRGEMFVLEAGAGESGDGVDRKAERP